MAKAANNKYSVKQAIYLYPTTGSSEDYHHAEGRFNYTLEIGNSFYPKSKEELDMLKNEVLAMTKVFMKNLINNKIPTQKFTTTYTTLNS